MMELEAFCGCVCVCVVVGELINFPHSVHVAAAPQSNQLIVFSSAVLQWCSYYRHSATHEIKGKRGLWNFSMHVGLDTSSWNFDNWYTGYILLRQKHWRPDMRVAQLERCCGWGLHLNWGVYHFSICNTSVGNSDVPQEASLWNNSSTQKIWTLGIHNFSLQIWGK